MEVEAADRRSRDDRRMDAEQGVDVEEQVNTRAQEARSELRRFDGARRPHVEPERAGRVVHDRALGALGRRARQHSDDLRRRLKLLKPPKHLDPGCFLRNDDDSQAALRHPQSGGCSIGVRRR
jgi:hypothetical protein